MRDEQYFLCDASLVLDMPFYGGALLLGTASFAEEIVDDCFDCDFVCPGALLCYLYGLVPVAAFVLEHRSNSFLPLFFRFRICGFEMECC